MRSFLPAEELAEELVMNPPEDLKVQVVEIRETTLNLRVVSRAADYAWCWMAAPEAPFSGSPWG